jgi:hypothetical protein
MQSMMTLAILLALLAVCSAFRAPSVARHSSFQRYAIDPSDVVPKGPEPVLDFEEQKLFDMNKNVRLGRSRDQDGKSNIWSIEPRMEVMEGEEEGGLKKNLFIVGGVIGAAIAALPLFTAFSTLVPDPAQF